MKGPEPELKRKAKAKAQEERKEQPKNRKDKWVPIMAVKIYRMALAGMNETNIALGLGVSKPTLVRWKREKIVVIEAFRLARLDSTDDEDFPRWIYKMLPSDLKVIWDQLMGLWKGRGNVGAEMVEEVLQDHGRNVRQQLFLHALCKSRFNPSLAMSRLNISKKELDEWIKHDLGFGELVEEIQWHKGNYFEERLMKLIKEGNPGAILFANKTFNAERGYGRKDRLDVHHSGGVVHGVVDLADVLGGLSEGAKMEVLEAIRRIEKEDSAAGMLLGHKTAPTVEEREESILGQIADVPD